MDEWSAERKMNQCTAVDRGRIHPGIALASLAMLLIGAITFVASMCRMYRLV